MCESQFLFISANFTFSGVLILFTLNIHSILKIQITISSTASKENLNCIYTLVFCKVAATQHVFSNFFVIIHTYINVGFSPSGSGKEVAKQGTGIDNDTGMPSMYPVFAPYLCSK
jgi:hypothetical protein